MRKERSVRRWLRFLGGCLIGIALTVALAQGSHAQANPVQAGLSQYHQGDLPGAIIQWEQALSQQPLSQQALSDQSIANVADISAEPDSVAVRKYLARAYQQLGQVSEAMEPLDQLADFYRKAGYVRQLGRILTEQAQIYDELGQPQNALALLDGDENSALAIAYQQSDPIGEAAALGTLGKTYYLQGNYDQAITALENSLEIADRLNLAPYQIAATNTLGNVYTSLSQRSRRYAQFAAEAQDTSETSRLAASAKAANQKAIASFNRGLQLAQAQGDDLNVVRSQLNLVLPSHRLPDQLSNAAQAPLAQNLSAQTLLDSAQSLLASLPDTREKAYSAIRIATLVGQLQIPSSAATVALAEAAEPLDLSQGISQGFSQCTPLTSASVTALQQAVSIARQIDDPIAESFALGQLGHLYECAGDYDAARQLTERAQLLTPRAETRYLWEWQTGRILAAQGQEEDAIAAYERTVETLKQVQGDIAIANRELRLDFRDAVEGIYRQLTELQIAQAVPASSDRLKSAKPNQSTAQNAAQDTASSSALLSALYALDGLRLAELRNYLGSECDLPPALASAQAIRPTTATLSTLVLSDRQLAVILAMPDANGQVQASLNIVPLSRADLAKQVNDFRYRLEQRSDRSNRYLVQSQQIYDWLIRPFETALASSHIQSLVFNHDGILRTVPMAALHDGKQFLVQSYAISNSPSFAAATAPTVLTNRLQVLAFGLSDPAQVSPTAQFAPLDAVETEIAQIEATVPNSTVFLNEAFTQERLQETLQAEPFSVLHLATHAQFGYDASDTFLVTGEKTEADAFNEPLRLNELYQLLREVRPQQSALQMLALTACETAAGSQRDALGIAGVALQAGVKSAIASLWQVEDQAIAELITRFYTRLQDGEGRSLALQNTQREWLASQSGGYQHPGYWAGLILVEAGT